MVTVKIKIICKKGAYGGYIATNSELEKVKNLLKEGDKVKGRIIYMKKYKTASGSGWGYEQYDKYPVEIQEAEFEVKKLNDNYAVFELISVSEKKEASLGKVISFGGRYKAPSSVIAILVKEGVIPKLDKEKLTWKIELGKGWWTMFYCENPEDKEILKYYPECAVIEVETSENKEETQEIDENKAFAGISASSNNNIINNINNTEQESVSSVSNFKKVKLVTFQLPSEYKGSKTKYQENGDKVQQVTVLKHDPAKFRTLRKQFYNKLHEVAWNSKIGWVLLSDCDPSIFSDIMKEFEKISGEKRIIEIIDVFLPRETVQVWLCDYISHVQQKVDLAKMKLENATEKEAKRYERELAKLTELLSKLERELKNL